MINRALPEPPGVPLHITHYFFCIGKAFLPDERAVPEYPNKIAHSKMSVNHTHFKMGHAHPRVEDRIDGGLCVY